ncbi:MAG: hypothetical protein M0R66_10005, partial [Candidatus Omnitrophica bacterium]|nr:hypothetical protein [Candidatus Omnitrophota bacterium]
MIGRTLTDTNSHERTIRWIKNEIQALKNRMSGTGTGEVTGEAYEPALGNPAVTGYVLSSTDAGVRSWISVAAASAHDVLSATHTDSTAAAVVRGDIIIGSGATPKWTRLGVGASGTYLAGGTEPSWATLNQAAVAGLQTDDSPTWVGATFSGLTASLPVVTDGSKGLASLAYATFKTNLAIAQADVSGLTTASSPVFATVKCSDLTDGYIPYHVSDAAGLADSPLRSTAEDLGVGCAPATGIRLTIQATSACEATLGAEMLTNNDFATGDFTGWTAGANWDAATGAAVHTAGSAETLVQSVALTNGIYYQVSFVVVRSAGSVVVTFGDLEGSYSYTTSGTKSVSFTATATAAKDLTFTPSSDFAGSIDSVSVKAITANATPALDIKSLAGTSMVPIRASATLYNLGIGIGCLATNTTGTGNVASGYLALYANTTGNYNVASGHQALYANTTGGYNVASGYTALRSNTTGAGNVASGYAALYANTTGNYNVASGYYALRSNTTGAGNVASGYQALYANTTGTGN